MLKIKYLLYNSSVMKSFPDFRFPLKIRIFSGAFEISKFSILFCSSDVFVSAILNYTTVIQISMEKDEMSGYYNEVKHNDAIF
jgi:hypothetical protein